MNRGRWEGGGGVNRWVGVGVDWGKGGGPTANGKWRVWGRENEEGGEGGGTLALANSQPRNHSASPLWEGTGKSPAPSYSLCLVLPCPHTLALPCPHTLALPCPHTLALPSPALSLPCPLLQTSLSSLSHSVLHHPSLSFKPSPVLACAVLSCPALSPLPTPTPPHPTPPHPTPPHTHTCPTLNPA